ncbi:MAG: ATP-binding cassette domain-containing protein, partial [Arenicellales bacterium]|nr:ATP-binding cassette domain-containing protein [Arenicellales bacterium]
DPERQLKSWPHQLSGGQRQRVMIAMALANEPRLLIADEPTTAVDVTTQAQILALLDELCQELDMALLLITHDLGVVRKTADRVYVMQGGMIVESGATTRIFASPSEKYTRTLIEAEPKARRTVSQKSGKALVEAQQLGVWFAVRRGILRRIVGQVKAVDGVSLALHPGRTVGVVGESGSGKTTLALALLRLTKSRGTISFKDQRIDGLRRNALKGLRRQMQIVFQDPYGSLSPRMSVGDIIAEGLAAHGIAKGQQQESQVIEALTEVGLEADARLRYPHEFSGGQRQRIALARALILKPALIVLDEPTSALDRAVQSQMIDLLLRLQQTHGLSYLFISHDLRVVRALADEIIVMRSGRVVEQGEADRVFAAPENDYTRSLIKAAMDFEVWNDAGLSQ